MFFVRKWKRFLFFAIFFLLTYILICLFLFSQQRTLIYRPEAELSMLPSDTDFKMPYQDVLIPIPDSQVQLSGWWIPAPSQQEKYTPLTDEPANILASPKVILYLCGVGRNMGDYNYLARVSAFRQLGFSVLVFDYRGYGHSDKTNFPSELQVYEDSQAAWNYLRHIYQIPPEQILIYGESLGGAIALDLALKHPEASGLIMQSTFTSMEEVIRELNFLNMFPIKLLLTEKFNSLSKIGSLQIPVLFLHGETDSVVPFELSQKLYKSAPEPKQLFIIPGADHVRIYQPGENSYLRAIQRFTQIEHTIK